MRGIGARGWSGGGNVVEPPGLERALTPNSPESAASAPANDTDRRPDNEAAPRPTTVTAPETGGPTTQALTIVEPKPLTAQHRAHRADGRTLVVPAVSPPSPPLTLLDLAAHMQRLEIAVRSLEARLPPQLVTVEEAAARLSVSVKTIRRRLQRREWPHIRVGRQIRIDLAALPPTSSRSR